MKKCSVLLIIVAKSFATEAKLRNTRTEKEALISSTDECHMTTQVACKRTDNGEPCDQRKENQKCGPIEGLFHFKYCNRKPKGDEMNSYGLEYIGGELNLTDGKEQLSESIHDDNLHSETCRVLGYVKTVDGCANQFEASIEVHAWKDDEIICTSSAIYKILKPASLSTE